MLPKKIIGSFTSWPSDIVNIICLYLNSNAITLLLPNNKTRIFFWLFVHKKDDNMKFTMYIIIFLRQQIINYLLGLTCSIKGKANLKNQKAGKNKPENISSHCCQSILHPLVSVSTTDLQINPTKKVTKVGHCIN